MGDALAAPTVQIKIEGQRRDLHAVRMVAQWTDYTVSDLDGETLLEGPTFDAITDSDELVAHAREVVDLLNGLSRIEHADHDPVRFAGTSYRRTADGRRDIYLLAESGRISIRGGSTSLVVTGADGAHVATEADPRERRLARAMRDDRLQDALAAFGSPLTWQRLRYVFDLVLEIGGGRHQLTEKGLATLSEIEIFEANVTDKRLRGRDALHGRTTGRVNPPPEKWSIERAAGFVGRVLRELIDDRR